MSQQEPRKSVESPLERPTYFFKHILFLDHDTSVCYQPELLDHAFVYVDTDAPGSNCKECQEILIAHNKQSLEHELNLAASQMRVYIPETYSTPVENPLSFARGFMYAAAISLVFWVTLIVLLRYGYR